MDITDSRIIALSLYALVLGVLLGIAYLAFSFARLVVTPSRAHGVKARLYLDIVTFAFDVTYALFASCAVVLLFFGANNGRIRLLGLALCALGFAIWHLILGRRLINAAQGLIYLCRRIIKAALKHTIVPVAHFLLYPIKMLASNIKNEKEKRKKEKKRKENHKKDGGFTL